MSPRVKPGSAPPRRRRGDAQQAKATPELPPGGPGQDRSSRRNEVRELSWAEFDRLVQELARSVQRRFRPEAVLGVAHGGVFVGGAVASALACEFYPVRISRRSRDHALRNTPKVYGAVPRELRGRRVLVVDDIASSGDTLELATAKLSEVKAREVQTAALVRRTGGYEPHHSVLLEDGLIVFPWDYEPVAEDGRFEVEPLPSRPSRRSKRP